jgi:hypothetical protein
MGIESGPELRKEDGADGDHLATCTRKATSAGLWGERRCDEQAVRSFVISMMTGRERNCGSLLNSCITSNQLFFGM